MENEIREFLISKGFKESGRESGIYELNNGSIILNIGANNVLNIKYEHLRIPIQ